MANKILLIFIAFDIIFLGCAVLHLLIPLITHVSMGQAPTLSNVASDLLLDHCPLTASMINSFIMFTTFLLSIPAFFLKSNRLFLTLHAWGVVACALLTLAIGLDIWYSTLAIHANLAPIWASQTSYVQSMLQFKFQCCGYNNVSQLIKDNTCTSSAVAARLGTCQVPFGVFASKFLDIVFTAFFGFVAVDMMLLLSALCLIKDRKEKARYRLIDEKRGHGPI